MTIERALMGSRQAGLPPEIAQAPLRTVRARDVTAYAHPRAQLARLTERGLLHQLADGFYAVVPQERVGGNWKPTLEGAAAGIASAEFGPRGFALMGMTAARLHRALPRAIAVAEVAAPRRRENLRLTDRTAYIRFLIREVEALHTELLGTDLGPCLVTTPEQTLLDVAHLMNRSEYSLEAESAIRALLPRCNRHTLDEIAASQRLKAARDRVLQLEVSR